MTDSMVERCVEAWKQKYGQLAWGQDGDGIWLRIDGARTPFASVEDALNERDRLAMRAAILSMREPTQEMIYAGVDTKTLILGFTPLPVYWAMIDQALKD